MDMLHFWGYKCTYMNSIYALAAFAALLLPAVSGAQGKVTRCGTRPPSQEWEQTFQQLIGDFKANSTAKKQTQNYTIPVVVHVVHGGQSVGVFPNLAQGQINAQIQVLNNDFAGNGLNVGNYNATAFAAWAATANVLPQSLDANGRVAVANTGIQFCLAAQNPTGGVMTEPGIDRINYQTMGWANPTSFTNNQAFENFIEGTVKPNSVWDVTKYLNIWISDEAPSITLLGFATFPPFVNLSGLGGAPVSPTNDGLWCWSKVFGSQTIYPAGAYYAPFNQGRTASHELGHWLGLRHVWGDGLCANDYCTDTPKAQSANFGTPTYPYNVNACQGSGNGEMFMNFMDYTDDPAMFMFTTDQTTRMQTAMATSPHRNQLGTHGLCAAPTITTVAASAQFSFSALACTGVNLNLINASQGTPAPSYLWSCPGATFVPNNQSLAPALQFSAAGVYTITLTASNGTTSVTSKTVNVTSPALDFSASSKTVCLGKTATVSASGANVYTWQPGNNFNATVVFTATASQSFTCTGALLNGCRTTSVVEVVAVPCVGILPLALSLVHVRLYPTPSENEVYLRIEAPFASQLRVEVCDPLGRVVLERQVKMDAPVMIQRFEVAHLAPGLYLVKTSANGAPPVLENLVKD